MLQHIDSVEQLEVLLFLHDHPDRDWTGDEVASRLRIDPGSAAGRLEDLQGRGLLAWGPEGYRYAPRREQAPRVDGLARCYQTHRVSLVTLIFSRPSDRIRSFAAAFRLRKEEDDG